MNNIDPVIQSDLLNFIPFITHGFLTRQFGKEQAKGISVRHICRIKQVHGNDVVLVESEKDLEGTQESSADIALTQIPHVALTISTADCVPLLFCDPTKKVIAAAHAGWRGTAKNVAQTTVQALQKRFHCEAQNIVVAIGPAIQRCCYEVDIHVYDQFLQKDFFSPVTGKSQKWMLSLPHVNRYQLISSGILDGNIWMSNLCTACNLSQFYSYRKEGEYAGRQWSFIALR